MAFPGTNSTLATTWSDACAQAAGLKSLATVISTNSAAGPIPRQTIIDFLRALATGIVRWQSAAETPGIVAYAREQVDNPALDIVAEFNAMVNAAIALRDWIVANFPKDAASGAWLVATFGSDGRPTSLTFTTAQLAQFRTNVGTFTATIS